MEFQLNPLQINSDCPQDPNVKKIKKVKYGPWSVLRLLITSYLSRLLQRPAGVANHHFVFFFGITDFYKSKLMESIIISGRFYVKNFQISKNRKNFNLSTFTPFSKSDLKLI